MSETEERPCGSCGEPTRHLITLRGKPMPACFRHTNVWRTPPPDYTCPTRCVEVNHPGREHSDWLADWPTLDDWLAPAPAGDSGGERG